MLIKAQRTNLIKIVFGFDHVENLSNCKYVQPLQKRQIFVNVD